MPQSVAYFRDPLKYLMSGIHAKNELRQEVMYLNITCNSMLMSQNFWDFCRVLLGFVPLNSWLDFGDCRKLVFTFDLLFVRKEQRQQPAGSRQPAVATTTNDSFSTHFILLLRKFSPVCKNQTMTAREGRRTSNQSRFQLWLPAIYSRRSFAFHIAARLFIINLTPQCHCFDAASSVTSSPYLWPSPWFINYFIFHFRSVMQHKTQMLKKITGILNMRNQCSLLGRTVLHCLCPTALQ